MKLEFGEQESRGILSYTRRQRDRRLHAGVSGMYTVISYFIYIFLMEIFIKRVSNVLHLHLYMASRL